MGKMKRSSDPAVNELLPVTKKEGLSTVWDRFDEMQPQCGFGQRGICCRICWKGPCRIDPFENGARRGVCGADADTIVARNLIRGIAAGAAAHSEHGHHVAKTLLKVSEGKAPGYRIKDEQKLWKIAARLNISTENKDIRQIAQEVAMAALDDFSRQEKEHPCSWLTSTITPLRAEKLRKAGVLPHNIHATVADVMARTHVGCDADPLNILLAGLKAALCDYTGMYLSTDLSDVIFGTPQPVKTQANLGVLKEKAVNIAVHGHNPLLSEIICDVALARNEDAIRAGAQEGINIVGMCCTGNEVMMRRGVPLATNYLSQEMAIVTGAVDAMVVDVQCIMPSLANIAECFHTELVTTMEANKIPGATHIEFNDETALASAEKIVKLAIDAFRRRDKSKINIPKYKETAFAGFSAEAIVSALSQLNKQDPLEPLIHNIVNGNIQGIALFAGCNNPNVEQDKNFTLMAKELAKNNVLLLATGCGAGTFAKQGLMSQEATLTYAGDSLKAVLTAIGEAAGLNGPLPLILHMGSCVDNTRAVSIAVAVANKLGVDLDKLPVVASAPEAMSEKAVAIGTWAVTLGLPTHLGVVPQVTGSAMVTDILTDKIKDIVNGYFIVETDPLKAAGKLLSVIKEKRMGLGI